MNGEDMATILRGTAVRDCIVCSCLNWGGDPEIPVMVMLDEYGDLWASDGGRAFDLYGSSLDDVAAERICDAHGARWSSIAGTRWLMVPVAPEELFTAAIHRLEEVRGALTDFGHSAGLREITGD